MFAPAAAVLIGTAIANGAIAAPSSQSDAPSPDLNLPIEGVVTNPDWAHRPGADEMSNFYPQLANFLGLAGHTVIHCKVSALGMVEDCTVASESPLGMGFGDASIAIAPYFRMQPRTLDGAPVGGAEVNIPIGWLAPVDDAPAAAPEAPTATPPTENALKLARRLAVAAHWGDSVQQIAQTYRDQLAQYAGTGGLTAEEATALDSLVQAILAAGPSELEHQTTTFAQAYTEPELSELVKFFESPTGQVWISTSAKMAKDEQQHNLKFWSDAKTDGRRRFCQKVACYVRPTIPTPPASK
ncbi:MAG: energy transducer TonB [Caulobacterales bacterium]